MASTYPPSEVIQDPTGENTPGPQGAEARGVPEGQVRADALLAGKGSPLGPGSQPDYMKDYVEGTRKNQQEYETNLDRDRTKLRGAREAYEADLSRPHEPIPQLEKVGPPPNQADYQKNAMAYLGAMSLFAAFAGRLSRAPAGASLQAFAAAANGWQEGNQQKYDSAVKQWEQQTKRLQENNRTTLEKYDLILKDRSLTSAEVAKKMELAAVERYDDQMYNAAKQGNLDLMFKLRDMQWNMEYGEKGLERALAPYKQYRAVEQEQQKMISQFFAPKIATNWIDPATQQPYINSRTGQPYTDADKAKAKYAVDTYPPEMSVDAAGGAGGKGGLLSGATKQEINLIADGIESGREPPTLSGLYGKSVPVRAELERRHFDLAGAMRDWQRAQVAVRSVGGPQMTRFVGLSNSVDATIDEAKRLAHEMKLSGFRLLNRAEIQAAMSLRGNTPEGILATKYMTTINTLKEEFANLAQGGYAPTEPVWKLANDQINADFGVDQLDASLSQVQRLIRYRVAAIPGLGTLGAGAPNRYVPGAPAGAGGGGADPLGLEGHP